MIASLTTLAQRTKEATIVRAFLEIVIGVVICVFVGLMFGAVSNRCDTNQADIKELTKITMHNQQEIELLRQEFGFKQDKMLYMLERRYPALAREFEADSNNHQEKSMRAKE